MARRKTMTENKVLGLLEHYQSEGVFPRDIDKEDKELIVDSLIAHINNFLLKKYKEIVDEEVSEKLRKISWGEEE